MTNIEDDPKYYFFEEEFHDQLDSWFSADIKCCDQCHDDFKENWPIVFDRLSDTEAINVLVFYHGSKLRLSYSEQEFLDNLYRIRCPRCNSSIESNFWAFEFEFDNFDEIEFDFHILKQDIRETPFIVLKNDLACQTFDLIDKISKSINPKLLDVALYRGRILKNSHFDKKDLLPPSTNFTKEGRYNHSGIPVIYASNTELTCFNELRKPQENLYIAKFKITQKLKLLDLTEIHEFENYDENNILKAIVLSSIASAKVEDNATHKPEYYFTRFISDCCKYLKFDGIVYPSVQIGIGQNYVFFDTALLTEHTIKRLKKYN